MDSRLKSIDPERVLEAVGRRIVAIYTDEDGWPTVVLDDGSKLVMAIVGWSDTVGIEREPSKGRG